MAELCLVLNNSKTESSDKIKSINEMIIKCKFDKSRDDSTMTCCIQDYVLKFGKFQISIKR